MVNPAILAMMGCKASAAILASDDFNAANGTLIGRTTPVGGLTWLTSNGSEIALAWASPSSANILDNAIKGSGVTNYCAALNAGTPRVRLEADVTTTTAGGWRIGIAGTTTSGGANGNAFWITYYVTDAAITVAFATGGTLTDVGAVSASGSISGHITLDYDGTTARGYWGSTLVGQAGIALTGTRVVTGIRGASNAVNTIDNLTLTAL